MKAAGIIFRIALRLPDWVYGRKALLDIALMYLMINAMARTGGGGPKDCTHITE